MVVKLSELTFTVPETVTTPAPPPKEASLWWTQAWSAGLYHQFCEPDVIQVPVPPSTPLPV